MGKLPDIEMIGVQESSDSILRVDAARRKTFDVLAAGFEGYGKELIKTQQGRAAAKLEQGLSGLDEELNPNKTVTTKYVREQLGEDFDRLPAALRAQLVNQGIDLTTGKDIETDREDIPMWTVAGAIFDARTRKLVADASNEITTGGWRAAFQDSVQMDLIKRKASLNSKSAKALDDYLTEEQTSSALVRANAAAAMADSAARAEAFVKVREDIKSSGAMDPSYKDRLVEAVEKMEQAAPVYAALRNEDYGAMAEMIGQLNDPAKFSRLKPEERYALSERLKAEVKMFQKAVKDEGKNALKANAEAGWNTLFAKVRAGAPLSYRDLPAPGTVPADDQKEMINYVDNRRKGIPVKTDLVVYDTLNRMWRDEPEKFAQLPLTRYINSLDEGAFTYFSNLQSRPRGPEYDNVVSTDEAIDSRIFTKFKIDPKKPGNDDERSSIAHVKSLIQNQLASLGHKPTLTERDEIVEKVLDSEMRVEEHWYGDRRRLGATTDIPPGFTVALREINAQIAATTPGVSPDLSVESIRATYKDFNFYQRDIELAWKSLAPARRKFSPAEALRVYGFMKAKWGELDAELVRSGQALTNSNRAALATQGYLSFKR